MKSVIKRGSLLATLVIVIVAFILGYLVSTGIEEGNNMPYSHIDDIKNQQILEEKSIEPVEIISWNQGSAKIKKKIVSDKQDGFIYQVEVLIDDLEDVFLLEVNEIEYKIISENDLIGIEYIRDVTKNTYKVVQWDRTGEGKLSFDDKRPIVVLDAGHGGYDNGEGSNDYWIEKDLNLKMTLSMKKLLEESGIRVILTRESDEYISLYQRSNIANYLDSDLFISNHVNKRDGEIRGVEIIYSSLADKDFANELAAGISNEDLPIYRVFNRRSDSFPQRDYYFVHKYIACPSYIIEYGFADSEEDTAYLAENWEEMIDNTGSMIIEYVFH